MQILLLLLPLPLVLPAAPQILADRMWTPHILYVPDNTLNKPRGGHPDRNDGSAHGPFNMPSMFTNPIVSFPDQEYVFIIDYHILSVWMIE
jgi:hypothetical protein